MKELRITERLRKCFRCQKTDTTRIAFTDADDRCMVYSGWCNTCNAPFSYRVNIDIVWDQEGRI